MIGSCQRILIIIFLMLQVCVVKAQETPAPPQPPAPEAATPAPPPPPPLTLPAEQPAQSVPPQQVVAPPPPLPSPAPVTPDSVAPAPTANGVADKIQRPMNLRELEQSANTRVKSPFMIPTELYLKIKRMVGERIEQTIDMSIDAKRRYPLKDYTLVGVLSNVKKPKAMILDRDGKMHVFKLKEFIANSGAFITEISSSEVIVIERGAELVLKLRELNKKQ